MSRTGRIVIVGASLAGVRAAEALRACGYEGRVTLVGEESHFPPYDRPPLSKQVLARTWDAERSRLRVLDDLSLDLMLNSRAVALDVERHQVLLAGSDPVAFDGVVVATGCAARELRLPSEGPTIQYLRTIEDFQALQASLDKGRRVVVIGAGVLGCEIAATCRGLGLQVSLVDVADQPMERVLGARIGRCIGQLHRLHGVELYCGSGIEALRWGANGSAEIALSTGFRLQADVVVAAVGAVPAVSWLEGSGLALNDGVLCDSSCFALGGEGIVVAAGDVARAQHPLLGVPVRVEHWTNAVAQAQVAARNLAARLFDIGFVTQYDALPYAWSDQYDWKIQVLGMPAGEASIVEGRLCDAKFVAEYRKDGRLVGAACVNWAGRVPIWRNRLRDGLAAA